MSECNRTVPIEESNLTMLLERDVDMDEYVQSLYLDLETGESLILYEDDDESEMLDGTPPEENAALRERIGANPERYLEMPELDHGDHHEILQEFLDSRWCDDDDARVRASRAYSGSIGRWKRDVSDQRAVHAYYSYRERAVKKRAEAHLRAHGVEPQWK